MRRDLLDILACPDCRGAVVMASVEVEDDAGIVEGVLRCDGCSREFPITEGIPRMLPKGADDE
jgi:uncharacterized protein YbaR (Trm112 family)